MKRLMMIVLFVFCATLFPNYGQAAENNSLKGTWNYKVPEAPSEYSEGKLIFAEKEGAVTGIVKFMDGTEIKVQKLKVGSDSISFTVEIESNEITLNGKIADGKIIGKVDSPQGILGMTAERSKI